MEDKQKRTLRVGVYSDSYPDKRMILNKVPEVQYSQVENRREVMARAFRLLGRKSNSFRQSDLYADTVHFTLDTDTHPEVSLIHTFNRICLHDRNPWAATFEKTFPEYFCEESSESIHRLRKYMPLILSEKCRALLPMSKWAYNYQKWLLSQISNAAEAKAVEKKMRILYPPQEILISEEKVYEKNQNTDQIRFFYVGSQIKRKGGAEVMRAFQQLSKEYHNFSVTVVGRLDGNYNNFYLNEGERKEVEAIISKASWIKYYEQLKNEDVLDLSRNAHVGILPSLGDTFGFSVLEMQASGCPVITTDRQALPEINNNDCGWILNTAELSLPHGDDFAHYTRDEVYGLSEIVRKELTETIAAILDYPDCIVGKARKAITRIDRMHNPQRYAGELLTIYESSL